MIAAVGLKRLTIVTLALACAFLIASVQSAVAQSVQFKQGVAEAAASDRDLAAFYKANGYRPIWTGKGATDKRRRAAFLDAISEAGAHGLPEGRYSPETLGVNLRAVGSDRDLGRLEVQMSQLFLRYARDIQTGILTPSDIDEGLVREVPYRSRQATLDAFAKSSPAGFFRALPPTSPEYARLMKAKLEFERLVAGGGWGPRVAADVLKPGATGAAVIQLRDRLVAMGYMRRNAGATYDDRMTEAVRAFQEDHGLATDGVAGPGTLGMINIEPETRLAQIIVAMERERWINMPKGKRHILVNITDFHARVIDDGKLTFKTRSVVGKNADDRRTPEFSDVMEHMVINPTWYVPRSITTKEYLPLLQKNPYAVGNLNLVNSRGQVIPREGIDFTQFTAQSFPFDMREPPNQGNALGLVKFMFPNRYNIYLHDTPAKSLFAREKRDFSHGCVRLNDPFDFAYTLLARQERDPVGFFQAQLSTGRETYVDLKEPVPVHIIYRTAYTEAKGRTQFRNDVYGRDAKIWQALSDAGVALRAHQG
ncbi:L,D-transpeptidase family protein [Alphaproteobacteria bacterium GH1-50]|uniref:L,D-transpeptidase family protein n=1 Tax=Kangsaoukella pontilimi TaxID=2691042 RepID=A0A7C9IS29_9RHOB|nr:L,D-transpeptidase family protein [Kangsaoukella pontilimi]MXQ07565.1 L,D-transpeptidase family protein [Kangsaoukella pontilimi]